MMMKIDKLEDIGRFFFEKSADLFCVADKNGRLIKLNPQWEGTLGYKLVDLKGKPFIDFVHPDDVEATIEAIKSDKNEVVHSFKNRYRHKDGSYRWLDWRSYSMEGQLYASARDITEQVRTEEELRISEEKYLKYFMLAPESVSILSYNTMKYIDVNEIFINETGFTREEIIGKTPSQLNFWVNIEDRDNIVELFLKKGKISNYEAKLRMKSGALVDTMISGDIITIHNEKCIITFNRNITKQKQAEMIWQENLHFLADLDKINLSIQSIDNETHLAKNVLKTIFQIYACDRVVLLYPERQEKKDEHVIIPVEFTRKEYPGEYSSGQAVKLNKTAKKMMQVLEGEKEPLELYLGEHISPEEEYWKKYQLKSVLAISIQPKIGKPWYLIIQQCSYIRKWTKQEIRLFKEIALRLSLGISNLLIKKDLKSNEEFLSSIFDNIPSMLMIKDAQTLKHIRVNKATENLFGYSTSEILEKSAADILSEKEAGISKKTDLEAIKSKGLVEIEKNVFKTKNKEEIFLHTKKLPILNEYGSPQYLVEISDDITRQIKAQKELLKNQSMLNNSLRITNQGSWEVDLATGRQIWTKETYKIFGVEDNTKELSIEETIELIHPDDRDCVRNQYGEAIKSGQYNDVEFRIIKPDGTIRILQSAGGVLDDENGKPYLITGIVQDITEKKEAETVRKQNFLLLENLDKVNRAIQSADNIDQMLNDVLQLTLSIFNCNRAYLIFPNDPESPTWNVPYEANTPDYPGYHQLGMGEPMPINPAAKKLFSTLLKTTEPQVHYLGKEIDPNEKTWSQFKIKSAQVIALRPKIGKAWQFGIHQCSHVREWTEHEKKVFREISRRLEDGLTNLLINNKLRNSEENYRNLVDNLQDAVFRLDMDGEILFASESAARLLGFPSSDSLVGKYLRQFVVYKEEIDKQAKILEKQGFMRNYVTCLKPQDAEKYIYALTNMQYLKDKKGKRIGAIGVFHDITERKKAEEALRESEDKFRNLSENAMVGIFMVEGDESEAMKNFIYVNQSYADIYGYTIDEMLDGLNPMDLIIPEDMERIRKEHTIQSVQQHYHITRKKDTGELRYVESRGTRIKFNGKPAIIGVAIDITDQVLTERALRESEQNFRELADNALIGIYQLFNEKFKYVNQYYADIHGYEIEELLEGNFKPHDLIMQEDLESLRKANVGADKIRHFHYRTKTKKGEIRHVESRNIVLGDEGNRKVIGTETDITDRVIAEKELRETKERLETFMDSATDSISIYDSNLCLTALNEKAVQYMNPKGKKEDFLGLHCSELLSHFSDIDLIGVFSEVLKTGIPHFSENRIEINQNDEYWFYSKTFKVGEGIGNMAIDITEKKKAEKEISEIKERLELFMESATDAISIYDSKLCLIALNKKALQYMQPKVNKKDIIGAHCSEIASFYSNSDVEGIFKEVLKTGIPQFTEDKIRIDKRNEYWFSSRIFKVGEGIGILTADVTEKKKTEREIQKLNADLEKRVTERTTQLRQANKDLEAFAYSISHDLRAPLRHIDGFLGLLYSNMASLDEKNTGYYNKIKAASKRMSNMIDELLNFSRLGRQKLKYTTVDLNILINDIIEQFKPDYINRNIKWKIQKLPKIKADAGLLEIAMGNIISNAIKYTSKKAEAVIEIGTKPVTGDKIEVYVKDNGSGFDMNYAEKLFRVFQRLHTEEEFSGIGIGLANVKQIISKHKGTITAESINHEGATFNVTLPK